VLTGRPTVAASLQRPQAEMLAHWLDVAIGVQEDAAVAGTRAAPMRDGSSIAGEQPPDYLMPVACLVAIDNTVHGMVFLGT
jgi:hypothetical protein